VAETFEIRLPAVRESLNQFYDFFRDVSTQIQLNSQLHFDIELSIEEALTNVISHAYGTDETGDFVLRITDHDDWVEIMIQDWGEPFDPAEIRPFDYNAPVETRINGGMGLHFMRTLMDSVEYHFDEHDGTILTMSKEREPVIDAGPAIDERVERELQVFDAVARALSTERNANSLLDLIVDKLTDVVEADRGTLYLIDAERGELYSMILQDETGRLTQIRLQIGEGVAGYVAETGETVNITDAEADPHFMQSFDRSSGYQTETMICTPMRNAGGDIIGVIQLLNKRGGVFTRRDEIILGVLASQAAIAIENARLLASEKEKRQIADTLRDVSSIINSSFELDEVLQLILREVEHVVPFDTASVLLIEDGMLVVRAGRGFENPLPDRLPLFEVNENPLMRELMETQTPIIIPDVTQDVRWVRSDYSPEQMRSWLGTPLLVEGRVIGELSINHRDADIYRSHHAHTIMTFANQAATAIERARLHEQTILQARLQQEVDTARTIQTSFLPDSAPPTPGWDIAPSWQPAKEVAGDFYDFIELSGNRLGFVVADVCGKGIPASLYMALSRTTLRVMAQTELAPDVLLERVNNQLKADSASHLFVTVFYGILDLESGELVFANGGHNPPFLYMPGQTSLSELASDGPALGVFPGVAFALGRVTLPAESVLVVYTDGITEAIDDVEREFGEDGLQKSIFRYVKDTAADINIGIRHDVKAFTGERPPEDDATLLIIKRNEGVP
jgi:serine phosphatase RsbU (regulator of sigma subunit)/anti-sigma regulatory factor (Ser/Thr protein kinase)/putative methionine-R-sulfoxide reductase with GAF domain